MRVLRQALFGVAAFAASFFAAAQRPAEALSTEDVLFAIVGYYNPTLAQAQPLVHCILGGGAVDSCAQQFIQGEALQDPNVQRMLQVMDAYERDAYAELISLAGVGVACAWVDNPPVVCSEFAQIVVEIGAEAINAQYQVAAAVVELFGDAAASVGCWTGIYCDDDDDEPANQYNAAAEWQRCFQGNVQEGLIVRLSGGSRYARLIRRQQPSHRFASDSLLGRCYPFVSQSDVQEAVAGVADAHTSGAEAVTAALPGGTPFSNNWDQANPWASLPGSVSQQDTMRMFADFIAFASAPLSDQYETLVEDAAASTIDEAAQDYSNLQVLWTARPDPQARLTLVAMLTNTGPQLASIPFYAANQRASCLATFDTPGAHMIDRWADSGAHANSTRTVRGINAANWGAKSPVTWCDNYYVPTFTQVLTTRRNAYDEALSRGCRAATARTPNPLVLQCPPFGGGMQRCRTALDNIPNAQCTQLSIVLQPVPQRSVEEATQSPPTVTTTAPPQAPQPEASPTPTLPNIRIPPATTTPDRSRDGPG